MSSDAFEWIYRRLKLFCPWHNCACKVKLFPINSSSSKIMCTRNFTWILGLSLTQSMGRRLQGAQFWVKYNIRSTVDIKATALRLAPRINSSDNNNWTPNPYSSIWICICSSNSSLELFYAVALPQCGVLFVTEVRAVPIIDACTCTTLQSLCSGLTFGCKWQEGVRR